MSSLNNFSEIFTRDLLALRKEIFLYKDESIIWNRLNGTKNSAGHLCLHLVGNLNHFVGAVLGNTGYQRQRDLEFGGPKIPREELLQKIDATSTMIEQSFLKLSENDLEKDYPLAHGPDKKIMNTHFFLIHLAGHLNYHLGQINYHRRYFEA